MCVHVGVYKCPALFAVCRIHFVLHKKHAARSNATMQHTNIHKHKSCMIHTTAITHHHTHTINTHTINAHTINTHTIKTYHHHRRAKEKRERLRTAGLAPDYVPLHTDTDHAYKVSCVCKGVLVCRMLVGGWVGGCGGGGGVQRGCVGTWLYHTYTRIATHITTHTHDTPPHTHTHDIHTYTQDAEDAVALGSDDDDDDPASRIRIRLAGAIARNRRDDLKTSGGGIGGGGGGIKGRTRGGQVCVYMCM